MLQPGQHIAVAVSGGADSVCLLHVLLELAKEPAWNLHLIVLHLNHSLRGEESRGDAEFVGHLASSLDLPFIAREANPAAEPGNLEWRYNLSGVLTGIGDVRSANDDLTGALESYGASLATTTRRER